MAPGCALSSKQRGLTQTQLGEALGMQYLLISRIELGKADPQASRLGAIARALNVSTDYLLELTKERRGMEG